MDIDETPEHLMGPGWVVRLCSCSFSPLFVMKGSPRLFPLRSHAMCKGRGALSGGSGALYLFRTREVQYIRSDHRIKLSWPMPSRKCARTTIGICQHVNARNWY